MKILLVNHYAGAPQYGMEYRPYYLAREWVSAGHEVLVAAGSYSHLRWAQPELGNGRETEETVDGVRYRWYRTSEYVGNGYARMRNIMQFVSALWEDSGRIASSFAPDAVISSSTYPFDIWPARRIARRARARLVFEVHDLWPLSPIEIGGMSRNHPFVKLCLLAERAAYRDSSGVVSLIPNIEQYLADADLKARSVCILPNGVAEEDWVHPPPPLRADVQACIALAHAQGQVVVGYAGAHGQPNALDALLDAAAMLRDRPMCLVLVGDGHERQRLVGRTIAEGLTNVRMFPSIPKAQIPAFLEAIDLAYLGWGRQPLYRYGICPNKLLDYMMAGCLIVHSCDAWNDPVREANCGLSVPALDARAIADGLVSMSELPRPEAGQLRMNGQRFVRERHLYSHLAAQYIEFMSTLGYAS